jgi:hypothetical protein
MTEKELFYVGFGRTCITPTESVPLAGYGNTSRRMSARILSDLFSTCVAFRDGEGSTVLLFHNDLIKSLGDITAQARRMISSATGIPFERIYISAPHPHSTPDMTNTAIPSIQRYIPWVQKKMVEAATLALEDLKPARMFTGTTQTKGLNFVRHYVLESGGIKGDNYGDLDDSPIVGHTSEADPTMQLVRFSREGGKDVFLVNWQTHPHRAGGAAKPDVTADIVGSMREKMESQLDCLMAYFSGGSGNINPKSRIPEENITADYLEQGYALADCALAAVPFMQEAALGKLRACQVLYPSKVNHTQDHLLEAAQKIVQDWKETNDHLAALKAGVPYGIHSPYHAGCIILKAALPESSPAVGLTLKSLDVRAKTGASVVSVTRNGKRYGNPGADWCFEIDDIVEAIGEPKELASLKDMLGIVVSVPEGDEF